MTLDFPSNGLIKKYTKLFNENRRYFHADQAILKLFKAFPENKKLEDIVLKISVINDLYSTNILGTFKMAIHIQKLKIDKYIQSNDTSIINKIAAGHKIKSKKNNKEICFYSFATKYCSLHKKEKYPIFDRFVEKILWEYQKQDNFSEFKKGDLKNFKIFKKVVSDFIIFYKISGQSLKEIDKFLWMYSKEKFPTKY